MKKLTEETLNESWKKYKKGIGSSTIARELGVAGPTLVAAWKKQGRQLRDRLRAIQKYKIDNSFFSTIDSEAKAYYLGFLYASGCMEKNTYTLHLELHKDDKILIESLLKALKTKKPIRVSKKKYCAVSIDNKQIYNDLLNKHGLQPEKSHKEFGIPTSVPSNLLGHVVRGYFDGGSRVSQDKDSICLSINSNHQFMQEIKDLIEKTINKMLPSLRKSKECDRTSILELRDQQTIAAFAHYIYDNATIFLKRRRDCFVRLLVSSEDCLMYLNYDFLCEVPKWDSEEDIKKTFKKLNKIDMSDFIQEDGSILAISSLGINIRRHFFPQIYSTATKHAPSMFEAFKDPDKLKKAYANREKYGYKIEDIHMALRGMRLSGGGGVPSFFSPKLAKWFYQTYAKEGDKILDICAGYGDRALPIMVCDSLKSISYLGLDSSSEQIRSLLDLSTKTNSQNKTSFLCIKAEDFIPKKDEKYDIAFTCPPYYDAELFHEMNLYDSKKEWLEKFWARAVSNVLPSVNRLFAYVATTELALELEKYVDRPVLERKVLKRAKGCVSKSKEELLIIHSL